MVALHVFHGLVNFGVQTPEIHARQNSYKWHAWINWDMFYFHSLDASTTTPELRTIPLTLTSWSLNLNPNPLTQSINP